MSDPNPKPDVKIRPVGGTEYSWCRAVPGGTGITVVALLLSKPPEERILQNALDNLQISHPTLRSKLRFDADANSFSFVTYPSPHVKLKTVDLESTAQILREETAAPLWILLEHELNNNTWRDPHRWTDTEADMVFVGLYDLPEERSVLTLRLHTSACDRQTAVVLLRELLEEVVGGGLSAASGENSSDGSVVIEDLVPRGKAEKPFWARGMNVLGYSLNALRLSNLDFVDVETPRESRVARLVMTRHETQQLVAGCESRGIKLCSATAAAGLMAAYASKKLPINHSEKYAVVTLMDCRSILEPVLQTDHFGFYHSGIMNTHDITGGETLWDLAKRCHESFIQSKNSNKHFSDMSDLNFLMCKAIENPHLTPSSSQRTALITVFEDPVIEDSNESMNEKIGLQDYVGCSSVHGVGPSIAVFDTIRSGKLDCACVYPWPLHSGDQIQGLVDDMKKILVEGSAAKP